MKQSVAKASQSEIDAIKIDQRFGQGMRNPALPDVPETQRVKKANASKMNKNFRELASDADEPKKETLGTGRGVQVLKQAAAVKNDLMKGRDGSGAEFHKRSRK